MMPVTPESHPARYFALLYASADQRPALEALFGIEREVFDSLRPGLDHHVAHSRLQWWREECDRAASGRAVHPLTRALVGALSAAPAPGRARVSSAMAAPSGLDVPGDGAAPGGLDAPGGGAAPGGLDAPSGGAAPGGLDAPGGVPPAIPVPQLARLAGIVDVAIWDLASATFETRRELDAYCQRWAAAMVEPLAGALGISEAARASAWNELGAAIREVELLADLAREAHNGRIRLPLDELQSVKIDTNAIAKPPWPDPLAQLLRARLQSLRNAIERNVTDLDREQQQASCGLLVWVALTWRIAKRVERALPNRLQPGRFDAVSDTWFAWRMARRATIGQFRLN